MTTDAGPHRRGEKTAAKVLGRTRMSTLAEGRHPLQRGMGRFHHAHRWGDVWARAGLDYRSRSIIVLSVATALGRWEEFRIHVKGAIHNGLRKDEIKEVLMQCAVYAGVPAANTAFHEAAKVFEEMEKG